MLNLNSIVMGQMSGVNVVINIPGRAVKQWNLIKKIPSSYLQLEGDRVGISGVYSSAKRVKDAYRYIISVKNGTVSFQTIFSDGIGRFNDQAVECSYNPSVVLIIESPHKDEYDQYFNPISVAQGATGRKIEKYICPILSSGKGETLPDGNYDVIISNPVQFQASLFQLHHQPLNIGEVATVRNKVWKAIYEKEKDNFLQRIKGYRPVLLLNGCTAELKPIITQSILEWRRSRNMRDKIDIAVATQHPCIWTSKTKLDWFNTI